VHPNLDAVRVPFELGGIGTGSLGEPHLRSEGLDSVHDLALRASFGGQYQCAICTPTGNHSAERPSGSEEVALAEAYCARETARINAALHMLDQGQSFVLWGMSTKGVIFANLMGAARILGGIDINPRKQGCFAPGSGVEIHGPGWLRTLVNAATILIMNPNYADEIRQQISSLGVQQKTIVI
jgi:hypothetical protein